MQSCETTIAIIALAGPIRAGLETLVASMLPANSLHIIESTAVPFNLQAAGSPDIALIDASVFGAAADVEIQRLRAIWPRVRSLVLVEDANQQSLVQAAGADSTMLKDSRAADLASAIERLIAEVTAGEK
jgi:DNA-binding NarL/FixJ family response regulator